MQILRRTLLLALSTFAVSTSASAGVLVVDATGGGGFTSIQAAVNVASDGDTILIKTGSYNAFEIDHKRLTVIGDTGAGVVVNGGILIKDTLPIHPIVLRNLTSIGDQSSPFLYENGLRLETVRGSLRIEDCTFFGSLGDGSVGLGELPGRPGVYASIALDVSFHDCTIVGGHGAASWLGGPYSAGGHGMELAAAVVSLHDCVLRGAIGADGDDLGDGADGGHGLYAHDLPAVPTLETRVHAAGSVFEGANGSVDLLCFVAGHGGDGILLQGPLTTATLLDNSYSHGIKGWCGVWGADGQDILAELGASYQLLRGAARDLDSNAPVREHGTLSLDFHGEPGDLGLALLSLTTDHTFEPSYSGSVLVGLPLLNPGVLAVVGMPVGGTVTSQIPVGLLPTGIDGISLYVQSAFLDTLGKVWIASPTTLVLLDQAY